MNNIFEKVDVAKNYTENKNKKYNIGFFDFERLCYYVPKKNFKKGNKIYEELTKPEI